MRQSDKTLTMRKDKEMDIHTPQGIAAWATRCGFETPRQAYTALGIPWRSWYRMRDEGLPTGYVGELIAEKMAEVERLTAAGWTRVPVEEGSEDVPDGDDTNN